MKLGAHVSVAGGLHNAPGRAREIGADCAQVFLAQPQRWPYKVDYAEEHVAAFQKACQASGVGPVFAHTQYLINLGSPDAQLIGRSCFALEFNLAWAARFGLQGVITHIGSSAKSEDLATAERSVVTCLERVFSRVEGDARLLLETSAGSGSTIGARFEQLGAIIRDLGRPARLGVCVDTAHVFASGYDLRNAEGVERMVEELDRHVGLNRLWAIHANDSKVPLGSAKDRHENIGEGHIGEEGFALLLTHPALREVPFLLEVPGYDGKGPDARNLQTLRRLAGLAQ